MCGGVCGRRDGHRDFFANGHVRARDAWGIVRGVTGFHDRKTSAEGGSAAAQDDRLGIVGEDEASSRDFRFSDVERDIELGEGVEGVFQHDDCFQG
jgi:hypothetical protein